MLWKAFAIAVSLSFVALILSAPTEVWLSPLF